jgi:hypothetical protein
MSQPPTYENFILRLSRQPYFTEGNWYQATLVAAPRGRMGGVFSLPLSPDESAAMRRWAERAVARAQQRPSQSPELGSERRTVQEIGTRLSQALPHEVRLALAESRSLATRRRRGLRICLDCADTPELAALPWEWLYDPQVGDFPALSRLTPVARLVPYAGPALAPPPPPYYVLLLIAAPGDAPPIDVDGLREAVTGALKRWEPHGVVAVDAVPARLPAVQDALRGKPYHVLHFIGHGAFDPIGGQGQLLFEGEGGTAFPVNAGQLRALLADSADLRWAVLSACQSGQPGPTPAESVAAALVQAGLPAVVAMQFPISQRAMEAFTGAFYGTLAEGWPVEAAVAEARKAVRVAAQNPVEWGTPACYIGQPLAHPPPWTDRLEEAVYEGLLTLRDLLTPSGLTAAAKALLLWLLQFLAWEPWLAMSRVEWLTIWPNDPISVLRAACSLGLGSALLPALLAWSYRHLKEEPALAGLPVGAQPVVRRLKLQGAYVGYWVGLGMTFTLLVLPLYYGGLGALLPPPLKRLAQALAAALPLAVGYSGARRVTRSAAAADPALRWTRRDWFLLLAFPCFVSPVVAWWFATSAELWLNRTLAPLLLGLAFLLVVGIAAWRARR